MISWGDFEAEMEAYQQLPWYRKLWHRTFWIRVRARAKEAGGWPWYWLRCHTWDHYNVIRLSGQDGYTWHYIDKDYAMLLACFALLCDFVENEDPTVGLRTMANYGAYQEFEQPVLVAQLDREREIRVLYDWWTKERKAEQALHDSPEEYMWAWDRDQEMLGRLVAVRGSLWT